MTRPDREHRFDEVDLQSLSTVALQAYVADLRLRKLQISDMYVERAYVLRIAEVERWQAIVNRRETERQEELDDRQAPAAKVPAAALSAAVEALGDVMLEMQRRTLLARGMRNAEWEKALKSKALTDKQIGERAIAAFQAGAEVLLAAGHIVPTKESGNG